MKPTATLVTEFIWIVKGERAQETPHEAAEVVGVADAVVCGPGDNVAVTDAFITGWSHC